VDGEDFSAEPARVFVDGQDFYLAGWVRSEAYYWVNDAAHKLPRPPRHDDWTGDWYYVEANDVHVLDGRAYVAGRAAYYDDVEYRMDYYLVLWADGELVSDGRAPDGQIGYQGSTVNSVFAQR
jgi:hypothetical protein